MGVLACAPKFDERGLQSSGTMGGERRGSSVGGVGGGGRRSIVDFSEV